MPVIVPFALGGGAKLYSYIQASQGEQDARNQLNRLNQQPVPKYNVNSAIARLYGGAANEVARPVGYTGAEINAFNQNMGRGLNTQRANAMNFSGGSGSRAINSVLGGNQLNAYNTFAGQDAALARQYRNAAFSRLMGAGNTMQNIDNQNTQTALQRRLMQEQLLGNAISSNRAYQTNALNSLGSDLMSVGAMGIDGGGGGGRKVGGWDGVGKTYLGRNSRISPYFNQNRANRQASAYDYLEDFPEYNQINR
jgi:hypothetical protein